MTGRDVWIVANILTIAGAFVVVALITSRLQIAKEKLRESAPASALLAWRRRDVRYLARKRRYSFGVMALGAMLIFVALAWEGPVPIFVVWGTVGFMAIHAHLAYAEIMDWIELGEVQRMVERERRGSAGKEARDG